MPRLFRYSEVSLSEPSTAVEHVSPTFNADVAGVFVASLIVNDGKLDSAVSTVPISAVSTVSGLTGLSGS